MGEIAGDMIIGVCCALCGQYFTEDGETLYEHGYPVACDDCWDADCGYIKCDDYVSTL